MTGFRNELKLYLAVSSDIMQLMDCHIAGHGKRQRISLQDDAFSEENADIYPGVEKKTGTSSAGYFVFWERANQEQVFKMMFFKVNHPLSIEISWKDRLTELIYAVEGSVLLEPLNCLLAQYQYNIIHQAAQQSSFFLRKAGTYVVCAIAFKTEELALFRKDLLIVSRFMEAVKKQQSVCMSPYNGTADLQMHVQIKQWFQEQARPYHAQGFITQQVYKWLMPGLVEWNSPALNSRLPAERLGILAAGEKMIMEPWKTFSIAELARNAHVNEKTFKKEFSKLFGLPVIGFLRMIRIEKARQLLTETADTIQDISLQVGFRNISNFSRLFKKETGTSPKEFRRALV